MELTINLESFSPLNTNYWPLVFVLQTTTKKPFHSTSKHKPQKYEANKQCTPWMTFYQSLSHSHWVASEWRLLWIHSILSIYFLCGIFKELLVSSLHSAGACVSKEGWVNYNPHAFKDLSDSTKISWTSSFIQFSKHSTN